MGVLWSRSTSFEFNAAGSPAPGAKAFFYMAGTSTPKPTYSDASESTALAHPVVADGNGRWPNVFIPYGSFKLTITTSGGTTLATVDNVPNAAPTDPAEGVDADSIFQTGDYLFVGKNGTRNGFVRCNGRTIGNAASGGTERANADTVTLFAYIWDNYANGQAAVSTGRGANAAADFAANKTIALPDHRAASLIGFDDMGNTAASLLGSAPVVSGSGILAGSILGANTHALTEAQLASHTHTGTTASDGAHTHTATTSSDGAHTHTVNVTDPGHTHGVDYSVLNNVAAGGAQIVINNVASGQPFAGSIDSATTGITAATVSNGAHTHTLTTSSNGAHTHTFTSASTGSGTAHNILSRGTPVTVLMKL